MKLYKTKKKPEGTKGAIGQNSPNSTRHTLKVPTELVSNGQEWPLPRGVVGQGIKNGFPVELASTGAMDYSFGQS